MGSGGAAARVAGFTPQLYFIKSRNDFSRWRLRCQASRASRWSEFRLVPTGAAGSGAPQAAGGLRLQPVLFLLAVVHCFWMVQCKPASHVPGGSPRPVDVGRHWVSAAWLDHVAEPMFHAARTWVTRPGSTLRRFWPWFSCAAHVPAARSGLSTWGDTGSPRRGSSTSPSPCSTRHGPGCPDQGPR